MMHYMDECTRAPVPVPFILQIFRRRLLLTMHTTLRSDPVSLAGPVGVGDVTVLLVQHLVPLNYLIIIFRQKKLHYTKHQMILSSPSLRASTTDCLPHNHHSSTTTSLHPSCLG
jgi:hypothetical protein